MRVLVLGAGKMVEAILGGLKGSVPFSQWGIFSPSGESAKRLSEKFGMIWVQDLHALKKDEFHFIMIGCKPQQLRELSQIFPDHLRNLPVISMLAALKEELQRKILGVSKLVRIMPNLPVEFGAGVVLISSNSAQELMKEISDKFSSLGHIESMREEELEELTLLTGSGPAFLYEFMENLSQSFVSLDQGKREELVKLVLLGSAKSVEKSSQNLSTLISSVTSKAGVTIEVLQQWRELHLDELVQKGIQAGKHRASDITSSLAHES